jgi:diguanylate cyclase (GGDEF)-like protein
MTEDGFLQKYNDGILWIDLLHKYPDAINRVKIESPKTSQVVIFELEFESFTQTNSFILFRDITREHHENLELQNRASYDALTKIYNRVSFESELAKELKDALRYEKQFSLIMFDIDHFKNVNDTYGHDVGDIILRELTSLVGGAIRETDFFARWGGEEFMIITHADIAQSEAFAEKLRELVESHDFTEVKSVTSSFGVAQYRKHDTKESIVKRCDEMLYSAKNSGRNCVVSIR